MSKRKPYHRPIRRNWFMQQRVYRFYMLREATSIFVGLYALILLGALLSLTQGEAAWQGYWQWWTSPLPLLLQWLCLAMSWLHALTWFQLTPKTMLLRFKGYTVPDQLIALAHYAGFAVITVILLGFAGGLL